MLLQPRQLASLAFLAGVFIYLVSWGLLPTLVSSRWYSLDVLHMAVLTGAMVSYGRAIGVIAWLLGVMAAAAGNSVVRLIEGGGSGSVRSCCLLAIVIVTVACLVCCLMRRWPCGRILVMTCVVAVGTGITVGQYLCQTSFWIRIGEAPVRVLLSWFVALVAGAVIGHAFLLIRGLGPRRGAG